MQQVERMLRMQKNRILENARWKYILMTIGPIFENIPLIDDDANYSCPENTDQQEVDDLKRKFP